MKWIGLTGGIGSGKTSVADGLRSRGIPVVDADELAKRAVGLGSSCLQKIVQVFGPGALNPDGTLNRQSIGQKVFSDQSLREALERIIHPEVRRLAMLERQKLEASRVPLAFYDVPLLFEKNMQDQFDSVVVVQASEENRKKRLRQRSGWGDSEIADRIKAQLPLDQKVLRADFVINNDGRLEDLSPQIEQLLERLKSHQAQE